MDNNIRKERAKALFIEKILKLGYVKAVPKKRHVGSSEIISNCACYFSSTEMYFSPEEYKALRHSLILA